MAGQKLTSGVFTLRCAPIGTFFDGAIHRSHFIPFIIPDDGEPGARPSAGAGRAAGGSQEARRKRQRWEGGAARGGGGDAGAAGRLPAAADAAEPAQGQAGGRQGRPPVLPRPGRRAGECLVVTAAAAAAAPNPC